MIRTWVVGTLLVLAPVVLTGCAADPSDGEMVMGEAAGSAEAPDAAQEETQAPPDPLATPDAPPQSSADPATGIRITKQGYEYSAPEGWVEITKQMRESGQDIDTAVGEAMSGATTVRENLNVVLTPAPGGSMEAYEAIAADTLEFMVKDLDIYARTVIDGREAVHVGGVAEVGNASFFFEQYIAEKDGTMFAISFAVDLATPEAGRRELIDSVLASWKWPA